MFRTMERNGCGHYESDGCAGYACEWSALDAISEERYVDGAHSDNGGRRYDRVPDVPGQAVVTDVNLSYLATMTSAEALVMADAAKALLLDAAALADPEYEHWCGRCEGKWHQCTFCSGEHQAVQEFLQRHAAGDKSLTEGLVHYWGNDIAGELRLFRGWCPHLPFDKRPATEEREWLRS